MGIFIKLLIVLVIIALAAPFFIKGQDGRPLITLEEIQQPDALENYTKSYGELGDNIPGAGKGAGKAPSPAGTKVYSWRDEQGNVHYSSVPPKDAVDVQTVRVNPDVNVISVDKKNEQALGKVAKLDLRKS